MSEAPEMVRPVSEADVETRGTFISRTYYHLLGAILAFTGIEIFLFKAGIAEAMAESLAGAWIVVLGGFLVVSWIASHIAHAAKSLAFQYVALTIYVIAESIIFVPLLYIADIYCPGAIQSAASVTLAGFLGLTAIAFITRKDFSFLRPFLMWGGLAALGLIVGGLIFGFNLGLYFSVGMVAFAGAAILYDTSNVIHRYPEDRYVGAALELFASVALLFWYVLRIFIASRD
jgi:hypothetical protein